MTDIEIYGIILFVIFLIYGFYKFYKDLKYLRRYDRLIRSYLKTKPKNINVPDNFATVQYYTITWDDLKINITKTHAIDFECLESWSIELIRKSGHKITLDESQLTEKTWDLVKEYCKKCEYFEQD